MRIWSKYIKNSLVLKAVKRIANIRLFREIKENIITNPILDNARSTIVNLPIKSKLLVEKQLPTTVKFRHALIMSRWDIWWFPALCILPYALCLFWLFQKELYWIVQIMLAPFLMGGALALLTFWLAKQEFRTVRPKKK